METVVGFIAGYIVGTRDGRDGLKRLRSSWHSIRTSPELRKLAGEAMTLATKAGGRAASGPGGLDIKSRGGAVSDLADTLARRAAGRSSGAA